MSDIIEQLDEAMREGAGELAEQAKAEIERLRAINAQQEVLMDHLRSGFHKLAAVNAELLAALDFYADPAGARIEYGEPLAIPDFYGELDFGERARAAIAKAKD